MTLNAHERAQYAATLLEDAALEEALRRIRERHLVVWENSKPEEVEVRERAFAAIRAIGDLKAELRSQVAAPKVTAFNNRNLGKTAS
jgi:hypothetical protein